MKARLIAIALLLISAPAYAGSFGNEMNDFMEGFATGSGHPVRESWRSRQREEFHRQDEERFRRDQLNEMREQRQWRQDYEVRRQQRRQF